MAVTTAVHAPRPAGQDRHHDAVVRAARAPWTLQPRAGGPLVVRGLDGADLAAVATLHARCSPQTLLQRYRCGGLAPSLVAVADLVRQPLVLGAFSAPGHAVALATADVDAPDGWVAEIGLLVADDWQRRGVGTALAGHLATSLRAGGTVQLLTRSASASLPLLRVMERVGETRSGTDGGRCTVLTTRIRLGAGGARRRVG